MPTSDSPAQKYPLWGENSSHRTLIVAGRRHSDAARNAVRVTCNVAFNVDAPENDIHQLVVFQRRDRARQVDGGSQLSFIVAWTLAMVFVVIKRKGVRTIRVEQLGAALVLLVGAGRGVGHGRVDNGDDGGGSKAEDGGLGVHDDEVED